VNFVAFVASRACNTNKRSSFFNIATYSLPARDATIATAIPPSPVEMATPGPPFYLPKILNVILAEGINRNEETCVKP
jgi:hypothetical protein